MIHHRNSTNEYHLQCGSVSRFHLERIHDPRLHQVTCGGNVFASDAARPVKTSSLLIDGPLSVSVSPRYPSDGSGTRGSYSRSERHPRRGAKRLHETRREPIRFANFAAAELSQNAPPCDRDPALCLTCNLGRAHRTGAKTAAHAVSANLYGTDLCPRKKIVLSLSPPLLC